jgi:hypothetical protein
MICFTKPVLIEDMFITDKPIFSSERMLHKEYYHKGSVGKKSLVMSLKGFGTKIN